MEEECEWPDKQISKALCWYKNEKVLFTLMRQNALV